MSATPPTPPPPATPPPAGVPAAAGPKQTQSILVFVLGLGSVVFSWTGIIGVAAGIAAIIVSNKAKKSEPGAPTWMPTVGVISGIVGIILSLILGIVTLLSILLPFLYLGSAGITTY